MAAVASFSLRSLCAIHVFVVKSYWPDFAGSLAIDVTPSHRKSRQSECRMEPSAAYQALLHRVREAHVLYSCAGVLEWDERTYMPRAGSAHRAEQMALLARLVNEMSTA